MNRDRKLRRVIRLGNTSLAVTLPPTWLEGQQYVWIEREDSAIVIRPAEVK
jgi:virulence-associated protein VagC